MNTPVAVVQRLLEAAIPERHADLAGLWDKYHPDVQLAPIKPGITMNSDRHRILFDPKTMEAIWLIGFNGWRSIETYAPAIVLAWLTSTSLDDALKRDEDIGQLEHEYKARMQIAQDIINAQDTSLIIWPPDIPMPEIDRSAFTSDQDRVVFDLVVLAAAFVFLHELKHVIFIADNATPEERKEEEIACDVWARAFMTEKLAVYAEKMGHDYEAVYAKRSMAMALGALILHEITPDQAKWGNDDYPPIAVRIESLIAGTNLPDNSHYWMIAACVLIGVMRQTHRPLGIVPLNYRQLVEALLEELRC